MKSKLYVFITGNFLFTKSPTTKTSKWVISVPEVTPSLEYISQTHFSIEFGVQSGLGVLKVRKYSLSQNPAFPDSYKLKHLLCNPLPCRSILLKNIHFWTLKNCTEKIMNQNKNNDKHSKQAKVRAHLPNRNRKHLDNPQWVYLSTVGLYTFLPLPMRSLCEGLNLLLKSRKSKHLQGELLQSNGSVWQQYPQVFGQVLTAIRFISSFLSPFSWKGRFRLEGLCQRTIKHKSGLSVVVPVITLLP